MLSDSPIKCTKLFSSTQPSEEPRWIHSVNNLFPINILTEPSGWMLTTCSSSSLENVAVSGLTWIKSKIRQSKDIRGCHPLHTAPPCRWRQSSGPCSRDAIKNLWYPTFQDLDWTRPLSSKLCYCVPTVKLLKRTEICTAKSKLPMKK